MLRLRTIISGGQTGADRGGLRAAIVCGLEHGGWCPKGRIAEDGRIPSMYRLTEDTTKDYRPRTRLNVRAADSTLIFNYGKLRGGTLLTVNICEELEKHYLVVDLDMGTNERIATRAVEHYFLAADPSVVNVAGPRESKVPGVELEVERILAHVLGVILKEEICQ